MKLTKKFRGYGIRGTKRPKFSWKRGRTWDRADIILPNGEKIEGHIDTTWGYWVYFKYNGQWYKINAFEYGDLSVLKFDMTKGRK